MIQDVMADPACWAWPLDGSSFHEWGGDRCAMCGFETARPVLDHDHHTGLCRGYLCRECNGREGHAGDFGIFKAYRERNPAIILGHREVYVDALGNTPPLAPTAAEKFDASVTCAAAVQRIWG